MNVKFVKKIHCEKANLQRHIRLVQQHIENIHEGKKPFGCTICNARFALKADANRHIDIIHGGNKPFTCSICDYKFSHRGHLNRHIKKHNGVKQHEGKNPEINEQRCE